MSIIRLFPGGADTHEGDGEGDRRFANRYPARVPIRLHLDNGLTLHGHFRDVGTEGAFLVTRDRLLGVMQGEEGEFGITPGEELDHPDQGRRFPCQVVRVEKGGLAVRFLKVPEANFDSDPL
ncbi:MAG: PilZ domain-containing protein [Magnetococcales bacterium]|nr:PilZ domain-containing protein [Magnetococcales bacterium]